jgi:chemotaxis protein MotB
MKSRKSITFLGFMLAVLLSSCVSNKKFTTVKNSLQKELSKANKELENCKVTSKSETARFESSLAVRQEQIEDLKAQVADARKLRDQQLTQVGDLTVLSKSANDNIKETLSQLEKKDKYIQLLQAARTKADSINLALAVNLKSVLKDGIDDKDIDIKVDKTVVYINLSDKMLYQSGSYQLTPRASEVLGKIAQIVEQRPEVDVMVEGYTDNVPYKNGNLEDNWDLSVKRATSVVRALQNNYGINPDKLIAAGRGQYNTLSTNDTAEGKSINRRTRIIILPKLNQFYDLLNPNNVAK